MKLASAGYALISMFFLSSGTEVAAQSVDTAWLQQAGVACGGGINMVTQGEIDAAILKRLRAASIEANGIFMQSDVASLLSQFSQEEKEPIYVNYVQCLLTLMKVATNTSGLPAKEVVLTSPIAVDPLEVVARGQRFVMTPGDSYAIRDMSLIFSLDDVKKLSNGAGQIYFTWSNSNTGEGASGQMRQASPVELGEDCVLVPYSIDSETKQASMISNC